MDDYGTERVVTGVPATRRTWLPWHAHGGSNADGPVLVYCFPHAGGTAGSYLPLARASTAVRICPVELPGRGTRFNDPPATDLPALVRDFVAAVFSAGHPQRFVLFGHSMGAELAYEAARQLAATGLATPSCLVVSGARPPGDPLAREFGELTDDSLVRSIAELQGTPGEVVANDELMSLLLPILRADLRMLSAYQRLAPDVLACAVRAYGGAEDQLAAPEWIGRWRWLTRGPFRQRTFPGGHFYLHDRPADLLAELATLASTG